MSRIDQVIEEINGLLRSGQGFLKQDLRRNIVRLRLEYEPWYTKALGAVSQITAGRAQDFKEAYRLDRRKELSYDSYTISDYLMGLKISAYGESAFNTESAFTIKLLSQLSILQAAGELAESRLRDLKELLRAELADSDMIAARELLKGDQLRSAGVVCGVVIECHLKAVAENHGIRIRRKKPAIADFNDALREADAYDVPTWRFIQRMGELHALCARTGDREPRTEDVEDLIAGTEKVIKEVF